MDSVFKKHTDSEFRTLYCTKLVILPTITSLKWSNVRKHSDVTVLGSANIAKVTQKGKICGILSKNKFIIGTDIIKWIYNILLSSVIYVGLAPVNKNTSDLQNVLVSIKIVTNVGDNIKFNLSSSYLNISHETGSGVIIKLYNFNLSSYNGQTVCAWCSTDSNSSMSVEIFEDVNRTLTYDNFEIPSASIEGNLSSITNEKTDSKVEVKDNGSINIYGGLTFKYEDISNPVVTYQIQVNQFAVSISNSSIKYVLLPPINNINCQYYSIVRVYPEQPLENISDPFLRIITSAPDSIEGISYIGVPAGASIRVMSNNINNTWIIV